MRASVVHDKLTLIAQLRDWLDRLPLADREQFLSDPMPAAAAESYLRRSLEALFDLSEVARAIEAWLRDRPEHVDDVD